LLHKTPLRALWAQYMTSRRADDIDRFITVGGAPGFDGVSAQATLNNGQWLMDFDKSHGIKCADGSRTLSHNQFTWANSTLTGSFLENGDCSGSPAHFIDTFRLKSLGMG
jgi:hypothetical protein